jgi:hypothetical protein
MAAASSGSCYLQPLSMCQQPQSDASVRHESKCKTQIGQFVRGMLKGFIVQASQLASCLLWEEEQKASGVMWEVQSLSSDLWYHPETAPAVEARLHELTNFGQGPSKVLLRDTLAWMIVAEFEMVDISQLANAGKQSTLDAVARQVAPCLCDNNDRRSLLLNAVHKNMKKMHRLGQHLTVHKNIKQMLRLGQHLTSSFDVPSASRLGAAKKKHKKYKHRRHEQTDMPEDLEDPDHGDSDLPEDFEDTDSGEMERLLEDSIENEFRMGSPSIADAVGRMPSYYLLAD